jgi:hypothetical protein
MSAAVGARLPHALRSRCLQAVRHRLSSSFGRALGLLLLLVAAGSAAACDRGAGADVPLTFDPTMVKGPSTAPVTIVEFSDYQ